MSRNNEPSIDTTLLMRERVKCPEPEIMEHEETGKPIYMYSAHLLREYFMDLEMRRMERRG